MRGSDLTSTWISRYYVKVGPTGWFKIDCILLRDYLQMRRFHLQENANWLWNLPFEQFSLNQLKSEVVWNVNLLQFCHQLNQHDDLIDFGLPTRSASKRINLLNYPYQTLSYLAFNRNLPFKSQRRYGMNKWLGAMGSTKNYRQTINKLLNRRSRLKSNEHV